MVTPPRLRVLDRRDLPALLAALATRGYRTVGPTVRDGAIVYGEISSDADLPVGWTDEQDAGRYRLTRRSDPALFGYAVGPHSWKKFLFPPALRLWAARRNGSGFAIGEERGETLRYAFVGVRACELRAMAIQDRVFAGGPYVDPTYCDAREGAFVVAVNCGAPSGTCFCASMDAGPRVAGGADLLLTEVLEGKRHYFVFSAETPRGEEAAAGLPARPARNEAAAADAVVARAAARMGRRMAAAGVRELLACNREHAEWDDVARRCLACANCTMVCPTCFCSTVEDVTDLAGEHAERWRRWDSCFTLDFSHLHGGSVRTSVRSRYRQWMTHKLSAWFDQFGSSGCVGCGRCIAWCPAGIDITREVAAIRKGAKDGHGEP